MSSRDRSSLNGGKWIRPDLKAAIIAAQNFVCQYCERDLAPYWHSADRRLWNVVTLDHIIPRSAGGSNAPANLAVCCLSCNSSLKDARKAPALESRLVAVASDAATRLDRAAGREALASRRSRSVGV
jgi:5-methylcytosine-specific restriction endonuclease McrA